MDNTMRKVAAFRLRAKGLTLKAVGQELGVGPTQAKSLADAGERIFKFSAQYLPDGVTVADADAKDIEIMKLRRRVALLEAEVRRFNRESRS